MADRTAAAARTDGSASMSAGKRFSSAIRRIGPRSSAGELEVSSGTVTSHEATTRRLSMPDKIRVGIVGATVTQGGSGWGQNAHVPALKGLPDYELKAVCTAHEVTAKASAAAFGAERAFYRFGDMAAHPEIDLIAVCVRVPGHHDLVMAGLPAATPRVCAGAPRPPPPDAP